MEKKTAMEELIDWADSFPINHSCTYLEFAEKCADMLPKEREQIEEAWINGKETKGYGNTIYEDASHYFTQNYGKG